MLDRASLDGSSEELGAELSRNVRLRKDAAFKGSGNKEGRPQAVVELPEVSGHAVVKFVHAVCEVECVDALRAPCIDIRGEVCECCVELALVGSCGQRPKLSEFNLGEVSLLHGARLAG